MPYDTSALEMDYLKLWSTLKQAPLADRWSSAFLLVELCLCSPYYSATVERLFSQMKVVKTDWRNRLNEKKLEDWLGIKISKVSLSEFSQGYADATLTVWASQKQRRLSKGKRKCSDRTPAVAKKSGLQTLDTFLQKDAIN